ncbi:hypothetical protein SNEBB_002217 [Seison nebaliae]|nr:hypothetical protein SNEBB_002217 [Seison nebaliae]
MSSFNSMNANSVSGVVTNGSVLGDLTVDGVVTSFYKWIDEHLLTFLFDTGSEPSTRTIAVTATAAAGLTAIAAYYYGLFMHLFPNEDLSTICRPAMTEKEIEDALAESDEVNNFLIEPHNFKDVKRLAKHHQYVNERMNKLKPYSIMGFLRNFQTLPLGVAKEKVLLKSAFDQQTDDKEMHMKKRIEEEKKLVRTAGVFDYSEIRITSLLNIDGLLSYLPNVKNLYDNYVYGFDISKNGRCLGYYDDGVKGYSYYSYSQAITMGNEFGDGLLTLPNILPGNNTKIGIYSMNRPKWTITEIGNHRHGMVLVPLYDTLGDEAIDFIVKETELKVIVIDKLDKLQKLFTLAQWDINKEGSQFNEAHYVLMDWDELDGETIKQLKKTADDMNVTLHSFKQICEFGRKRPSEKHLAGLNEIATICYTSGTTGPPKGVMLTHENLLAVVVGCWYNLRGILYGTGEILISYLPLAHMFERSIEAFLFMQGGAVGYYRGNVKALMEDMKVMHPTIFPTVPRLLNRMYDKIIDTASSSKVKKSLFKFAFSRKLKLVRKGIVTTDTMWDKYVFHRVQQSLGGEVKFIVTGSAPLSPSVLTFTRVVTGAHVLEGYGQTEIAGIWGVQIPGEVTCGNVGVPYVCNYTKLIDIPEMNYYATSNRGEVCIKGTNVFPGYFKNPEKTKEVIDEDGWLHTGDVGMWTEDGLLKIVDRKKHIFKLAQGEYVAPEKIEQIYMRHPLIAQVFVYGTSLQSYLVGLIFPDFEALPQWMKDKGGKFGYSESKKDKIFATDEFQKFLVDDMTTMAKQAGLNTFETIKRFRIIDEAFSIENELLTPTFKTKRPQVLKKYDKLLNSMYDRAFD